ncbi:hypothetical protein LAD12857_10030 [Lacrimispora amygdalina]|uniref:Uncharacterized protein n=1 Tax=Lacrimispora amygdalina TaxID=253257 RepID=A0A3E2NEV4_9FIRM|nr:hypothetical protein [Clostridium indicum]RFZ79515.1 hypothetical protein DS742_08185 [Clostridium indicum]
MTNIVGITVYGVLYLVVMLLLFVLFFLGRDWLMLTGLSGFLLMGLILSITVTRYNYIDMIHNKNMVEVSRTERIPEVVKVGNLYRSNWKTVQIAYGLSGNEKEYYSVMRSRNGLFVIEGGILHMRNNNR